MDFRRSAPSSFFGHVEVLIEWGFGYIYLQLRKRRGWGEVKFDSIMDNFSRKWKRVVDQ